MTLKLKDKAAPKKSKTGITWLALVVDRSGSMSTIAKDMEGGIATLFKDQVKEPGECLVTLVQFDDKYEVLGTNVPIADIESYELKPRGSTALLDAVGKAVTTLKEKANSTVTSAKPENVIVVIVTDGYENASKEWKRDAVKALIEKQTGAGWQFTYLGANQDSFAEASSLGIDPGSTLNFTPDHDHTHAAYGSLSANVTRTRATGQSVSYSNEERRDSALPEHR
jgi:Mg-chelatase subunit ChlD